MNLIQSYINSVNNKSSPSEIYYYTFGISTMEQNDLTKLAQLVKEGLYSIEPLMKEVDRPLLSLAYSPGVATVCTDIDKDISKADTLTMRLRSAAIVSDGSLLGVSPKEFAPVMDWFVFQMKKYVGFDAYPFLVMQDANMTRVFQSLAHTYTTIIYLDNKMDFKVTDRCLFIRHPVIAEMTKSSITDASRTANVVSHLASKGLKGEPTLENLKTAIEAPILKVNHHPDLFKIDDKASLQENARKFHHHYQGKIHITASDHQVEELSKIFTEANLKQLIKEKTVVGKTSQIATIVTDGTAILGLGNIGPRAGLPVMEGKSLLFKLLGGVQVVPLCIEPLNTKDQITTIKQIAGNFMAINLEDIKAPECFDIEQGLKDLKAVPIFHDDQHGTAIVTLAALINALKLLKRQIGQIKVVINGAGAAGITIAKLIVHHGVKKLIVCDSKGAIYEGRQQGMNGAKVELAKMTNQDKEKGSLGDVISGADVFIGVSVGGALTGEMVKKMNKPIIFAMANPTPEIFPDVAKEHGAYIYGSGRSDFKNQINNSLVFPGIFRGIKEHNLKDIPIEMHIRVAQGLAKCVGDKLSEDFILPDSLDLDISRMISEEMGRNINNPKL